MSDEMFDWARREVVTQNILQAAYELGIRHISIGVNDPNIKSCNDWPFGYERSLFAEGKGKDGWPVVWKVLEKAGYSRSAGNGGQAQMDNVPPHHAGSFKYINDKWEKVL